MEEQEAYMVKFDFVAAHASFLESKRRYAGAAELYLQEGQTLHAIELLLKDSTDRISGTKAKKVLMEKLWSHLSFGVQPNFDGSEESVELHELFRFLKLLNPVDLDSKDRHEVFDSLSATRLCTAFPLQIEVFTAIYSSNTRSLKSLGPTLCVTSKNEAIVLLCLDHLIDDKLSQLEFGSETDAISSLNLFLTYTRLMHKVITQRDPWASEDVQKLFSFDASPENQVTLHHGSFLYRCHYFNNSMPSARKNIRVSPERFTTVLRHHLIERLRSRVLAVHEISPGVGHGEKDITDSEHKISAAAEVFGPRPISGSRPDCVNVHHHGQVCYNCRVKVHLQQVIILHTFQNIPRAERCPYGIRRYVLNVFKCLISCLTVVELDLCWLDLTIHSSHLCPLYLSRKLNSFRNPQSLSALLRSGQYKS
jgi:hypothetical protein